MRRLFQFVALGLMLLLLAGPAAALAQCVTTSASGEKCASHCARMAKRTLLKAEDGSGSCCKISSEAPASEPTVRTSPVQPLVKAQPQIVTGTAPAVMARASDEAMPVRLHPPQQSLLCTFLI